MAITNADGSIVLTTKVDQSGLKRGMSTMKSGVSSLIGSFGKLAAAVGVAFSVGAIVKFSKEASNLATTAEASVQRLIDIYGEASKAVGDFIDSNAQALGMSRTAAASYASVYGNLFSVWADQATNAELTNRYLNMTAVVASKTGRTVEDVQERIRSGLLGNTEAIEDLGVFVNVKTIEMTDAFKRMADGKSWEQLDAYTQQQIRTFAILEQATAKYGNEVAKTSALTKSQFRAAWQDFQATWGQVVNRVLIPVLEVLTDILVYSTAVMQSLFNISSSTISQGEAISTATDNQNKLTKAVEETNEAMEKTTASFDTVEILSAGTAQNASTEPIIPEVITGGLGESLEIEETEKELSAFEKTIKEVIEKIQGYFKPLKDISLENLKTSFDNLMISLTPYKDLVLAGLDWLWNDFLVPVSAWVVEDILPQYLNLISEKLDLLSPTIDLIKDGLSWFWNDIIVPMGVWVVEDAVPSFIDMVAAAISALTPIIEAIKPTLSWLWDDVITPMATFVGDTFTDFLGFLTDKFTAFSDWASENETTVKDIFDLTLGFLAGIWVYNTTKKILDFLPKLGKAFTDLGTKMAEGGLKGAFFAAAVGILAAGIISLSKNWDKMTPAERAITILGALAAAATAAAIAIGIFHTAWSVGVAAAAIAGGLALLGLTFAFSDTGDTGDAAKTAADNFYSSYDWNKDFSLPKLAKGTVVPPNKEFMAILGDNTKEHEIVSPVSTMKQAFMEAMIEMGGNFGGGNTEVVLEIDGREFGRAVVEQGNRENRRIGTRLVIV